MNDAIGHAVLGEQALEGGGQRGCVVDIGAERYCADQLMLAYECFGLAGQIEAEDLRADAVELDGDGRAEVAGAAGDPDLFTLERIPGAHLAVWPPSTGILAPVT